MINFIKTKNMRKPIFLTFAAILLTSVTGLMAQVKLLKLWETDSVFKVPESVFFDKNNNLLYVSNIEGTEPWGRDGKGSIGKMGVDGKVIQAEWVTGFHAPKGMTMRGTTLYVADMDQVVAVDTKTGTILSRILVEGAQGLNDISISPEGSLYVSDSRTKRLYKIDQGAATVYLSDLKGPNGVLCQGNKLYILDAGTLYSVKADKSLDKIAEGMEGGTDGVEEVKPGEYIVSCWQGLVYYVSGNGKTDVLLDSRAEKKNAADIGYDAARRIVYVPTFWRNTVVAYQIN